MSDADRWRQIESIFHDALERAPEGRSAFLEQRCGGDEDLRREVEALLAADAADAAGDGGDPIAPPSPATMATALEESGDDPFVGQRLGAWTIERVLGTGGMGKVYLASRAAEFQQYAAVKLIRRGLATDEILARFRHERATLARLEHPGIARLLDGGATEDGLPWLAMEYVEGEDFDDFCDARRLDVRARLELFASVCDAVAYAHGNLVVHRDLKPSNILVGADGTPRLLDFGIAKVLDTDEGAAVTVAAGTAPMTPAYASPEQILGATVGTASDVYTLGVILYELLSGRPPYKLGTETAAALERAVCEQDPERPSTAVARPPPRVAMPDPRPATAGAPEPETETGAEPGAEPDTETDTDPDPTPDPASVLPRAPATPAELAHARSASPDQLRRRLSGDLDNIVLMALAKEPERRYASVADLADDVRRHLAGLPVRARAPTFHYRMSKFLRRHVAASVLAAILLVVVAVAVTQYLGALRRDRTQLADIMRLSDGYRIAGLIAEMNGPLWPARPDRRGDMDDWLDRARDVVGRRDLHEQRLATLAARLEAGATDEDTLWWHDQLRGLVTELAAFAREDAYGETLIAMRARRLLVDEVERLSLTASAADWERAIASIRDVTQCPRYSGLELTPQWSMAPLRRNPETGLWEFWEVQTGEPPEIDEQGKLIIGEETALVFVLLPGGTDLMGAQASDMAEPNFDPMAGPDEQPTRSVRLAPFFLSKYEMTQGQWLRVTGSNPSDIAPPMYKDGHPVNLAHPVEQMSWVEARDVLHRLGLELPTESQWEYGARAETDTPWWTGDDVAQLDQAANLADLYARDHFGSDGWSYAIAESADLDDGHTIHAPVGTYLANGFGLHEVHGNVWEWCRDMPAYYAWEAAPGDGAHVIPEGLPPHPERICRGGAFANPPNKVRSAARWSAVSTFRTRVIGLRPARVLQGR